MNKVTLKQILRYTTEADIARHFDITPAAVNQWHINGIPASRIIGIEMLIGGQVSRHDMSPSLYPID